MCLWQLPIIKLVMMVDNNITFEQAKLYLSQLNLAYIVSQMCAEDYALPRWTSTDAMHCATLYKRFLLLKKKHFALPLVPTKEIDEFWHNHILHTQRYMQDCQQIFGTYLHHTPASPDEDIEQLLQDFEQTKQLYLAEFGIPLDNF